MQWLQSPKSKFRKVKDRNIEILRVRLSYSLIFIFRRIEKKGTTNYFLFYFQCKGANHLISVNIIFLSFSECFL